MRSRNGFTLVEMMIVIAIMGILFAIAIPFWNNYRQNADLRTAARIIAADIADAKARATTERSTYTITFNVAENAYQIARRRNPGSSIFDNVVARNINENISSNAIKMSAATFFGAPDNRLRCDIRGTTNNGRIVLRNTRNSMAIITVNITGRTNVAFNIQ